MTRLANPAWVDKALTRSWPEFEARTPPIVAGRGKRVRGGKYATYDATGPVVSYHADELGCGHYGCVLRTPNPSMVVKLTTDESEARFVTLMLDRKLQEPGLVRYHDLVRLPSSHGGNAIYAIWREAADQVGEVFDFHELRVPGDDDRETLEAFAAHLVRFKALAAWVMEILLLSTRSVIKPGPWELLDAARPLEQKADRHVFVNEMTGLVGTDVRQGDWPLTLAIALLACKRTAEQMQRTPGRLIGKTLASLLDQHILLADVHQGNVGRSQHGGHAPIITDPGHMVALSPALAKTPLPAGKRKPNPINAVARFRAQHGRG